MIGLLR